MPTTPGYTLTFTLENLAGSDQQGQVVLTLANYTGIPRVSGTSVQAPLSYAIQANSSGEGSQAVFGNDQITTTGTCYNIAVYPPNSGVPVSSDMYLLTGSGGDLSSLTPIVPNPPGNIYQYVTITGSPASGELTMFSGPASITNGNLTGDVTTSGSTATTLATVNSDVGSFTSANITVDAKGRITAASNGSGGGGSLQTVSLTLSSAQLLAMPTPILFVPAQGANTVIMPQAVTGQYNYGTIPYVLGFNDNGFAFVYNTTGFPSGSSAIWSSYSLGGGVDFLDQTASQFSGGSGGNIEYGAFNATSGSTVLDTVVNQPLYVGYQGTTPGLTGGDGTVVLTMYYTVVTVS